jgi:hypothetical protein
MASGIQLLLLRIQLLLLKNTAAPPQEYSCSSPRIQLLLLKKFTAQGQR